MDQPAQVVTNKVLVRSEDNVSGDKKRNRVLEKIESSCKRKRRNQDATLVAS